jgi:putative FmdB family regulatory protein
MPRYKYSCELCEEITDAFHLHDETLTNCEKCNSENSLKKILSVPYYGVKKLAPLKKKAVGEITKKYIEENRELLEQQKEEIKNKDYDKT